MTPTPEPVTEDGLKARERIERLKSEPSNVAAQLLALTQISDCARVQHRDNFDGYLIAAAELLNTEPARSGEGELREACRVAAQAFRTLEEVAVAHFEHDKARNFIKLGDMCRVALSTPLEARDDVKQGQCTVGSCQRHGRCMYLNHPRCPYAKLSTTPLMGSGDR
jgi:hypothetical protein